MSAIFECARCRRIFKHTDDAQQEAAAQAAKDFPLDFKSQTGYGGIHKVCEECYKAVMSQGFNTPKVKPSLMPMWKKFWRKGDK